MLKKCFRCGESCHGYLCDRCRRSKIGTRVTALRKLRRNEEEVFYDKNKND